MGTSSAIRKVTWWEPYRSAVRASVAELASTGVLRRRFWVRVMAVSIVVVGALIALILWTNPGIALPWPQLAAGLVIAPALVALPVAGNALAPRHVDVRPEWIQFSQGQAAVRIRAEQIESVTIEGETPAVLVLAYHTPRGKARTQRAVIGPRVDRAALAAVLDELADVRNRRVASIGAPSLRR